MQRPFNHLEKLIEKHIAEESVKEEFYTTVIEIMALIGKEKYGRLFNNKPDDQEVDHSS